MPHALSLHMLCRAVSLHRRCIAAKSADTSCTVLMISLLGFQIYQICNIKFLLITFSFLFLKQFKASTSWLHRASNNVETFLLPTDAHNVKKHRVIKTF